MTVRYVREEPLRRLYEGLKQLQLEVKGDGNYAQMVETVLVAFESHLRQIHKLTNRLRECQLNLVNQQALEAAVEEVAAPYDDFRQVATRAIKAYVRERQPVLVTDEMVERVLGAFTDLEALLRERVRNAIRFALEDALEAGDP